MGSEIVIVPIFFAVLFAIAYLYFSTRNKERLALIEKGADASIFVKGKKENTAPFWKVLILNVSLLLMGIGMGIFVGSFLETVLRVDNDIAYLGAIFLLSGVGLMVGFTMTKKLDEE